MVLKLSKAAVDTAITFHQNNLMNNKLLVIIAIIAGALFLAASLIYFTQPAKSLPNFFPGYDPDLTKIHFKHGIGALFLGLGAFVFAWFQSGKNHPNKNNSEVNPPKRIQ